MSVKEIGIERKKYADILDSNISAFLNGAGKNIALLGGRKSGKSTIAKRLMKTEKNIAVVYVDFGKISMSPESFAVEFIGAICWQFLHEPVSEYKNFMGLDNLLKYALEMKSARAHEILKSIQNEISKIKPDQRLLAQLAFNFSYALADEKGIKILLILDNFENIFDLNNFEQIKDIISLVNFNHESVKYIAASSAQTDVKRHLRNFEFLEIQNFDKNEIMEIVKKATGKADNKLAEIILELSKGVPIAANEILKNLNEKNGLIEKNDASASFFSQLLCKNGVLYNYCHDSLNYYLNRTRGQVLSKIILKVIASEKELRLSDIARKIYRSAPVTKSLLERLISADIIYRKDNKFYFYDPMLKLWLKLSSMGYEFDDEMDEKNFKEVLELI